MSANTSSAVMAQRHEPHDSLEDFPTSPWATRALIEYVIHDMWRNSVACDPACNRGYMVHALKEYFLHVLASDIFDYGYGFEVCDYLFGDQRIPADWIITNPPFRLAEQFIEQAMAKVKVGFAMFVRTSFLESVGRYQSLFSKNPPAIVAQFSERVVLHKGICRDPNIKYLDKQTGKMKKPTTATSYCWMVWIKGHTGPTELVWIPPCRKTLERPGDYDLVSLKECD